MKKDKRDNLFIIFILFQSGELTDIDKLLMSCQAFIFPTHLKVDISISSHFMLLWQSLENAHKMCCQPIHRRIELVPSEGEKIGNVAIGQNQGHVRLEIEIQNWAFRDFSI